MAKIKISFERLIKNHKEYVEFGLRKDLPIKTTFQYSKVLREMNEEILEIEKIRGTIISKYELDKAENHANPEINAQADKEWDAFIKSNYFKFDFDPISVGSLNSLKEGISSSTFNAMSDFFTE